MGDCRVHVYRVKGTAPAPSVQMLMDAVCIDVIGAGTSAKATAFMYSEVVTPTASLHHNGVLEMPSASAVGKKCQLRASGREPLPGVEDFLGGKMFVHLVAQLGSGDQRQVSPEKHSPLLLLHQLGHIRRKHS